jgi:hypothetical protein
MLTNIAKKRVLYLVTLFLLISVGSSVYLIHLMTVSEESRMVLDKALVGSIGSDPMLDCQLCEAIVNQIYKLMPEKTTENTVDSVIIVVFNNIPDTWRYIRDDIRDMHYIEFRDLVGKKFEARTISTTLGYCK